MRTWCFFPKQPFQHTVQQGEYTTRPNMSNCGWALPVCAPVAGSIGSPNMNGWLQFLRWFICLFVWLSVRCCLNMYPDSIEYPSILPVQSSWNIHLELRHACIDNHLLLRGHVSQHLLLNTSQQERSRNFMQLFVTVWFWRSSSIILSACSRCPMSLFANVTETKPWLKDAGQIIKDGWIYKV